VVTGLTPELLWIPHQMLNVWYVIVRDLFKFEIIPSQRRLLRLGIIFNRKVRLSFILNILKFLLYELIIFKNSISFCAKHIK